VNFAVGKCVLENVHWQKKCDCSNEKICNKHVLQSVCHGRHSVRLHLTYVSNVHLELFIIYCL
jgi:hypothetical protein